MISSHVRFARVHINSDSLSRQEPRESIFSVCAGHATCLFTRARRRHDRWVPCMHMPNANTCCCAYRGTLMRTREETVEEG
jgi:hypothetical protein